MTSSRHRNAIGYVRVSVDDADKVSPDAQRQAIRQYADRKGWNLVEVIERGKSAGQGKRRPKFDRLREQIAAGSVDALIVYRLDRATRSVADFADLWRELEAAGAEFVSVSEGFDTSTAMGKAMLQIAVVFAELERSTIVERTKDVHRYRRSQQMAPTGIPAYGYRKSGTSLVVEPAEAEWVGRIVDWLLDGVSLREVARRMTSAEAPPMPRERCRREKRLAEAAKNGDVAPTFPPVKFGWTAIRLLALSPTIAGLRLDPDSGANLDGGWEAIIDRPKWEWLSRVLSDPARRVSTKREPSLLSGIATCGKCGTPLRTHRREGRLRYRCAKSDQYKDACQGLSIDAEGLEEQVVSYLMDAVDGLMLPSIDTDPVEDSDGLRIALDELADAYGSGDLALSEWQSARKPLLARIAAADSTAGRRERNATVSSILVGGDLRTVWADLSIGTRRAISRQVFSAVEVRPASRRGEVRERLNVVVAA